MARNSVCERKYVVDSEGLPAGMTFKFSNGHNHTVYFGDFTADVRSMAEAHGFNQSLGDSFSSSGGDPNVAEGMFLKRLESLNLGEWAGKRGGGSAQADIDLAKALAEVTGKSLEEAQEGVEKGDKEWKAARRKHPAVAEVLARLDMERKAKKAAEAEVSTDNLL